MRFRLNGAPKTLGIVGHDETEPAVGRISFTAPLVRAMLGAAVGEVLPFGGVPDALEIVGVGVMDERPASRSSRQPRHDAGAAAA